MNLQAIYHRPEVPYAYPIDEETLYIKIRVAHLDITEVWLFYHDRYEETKPMICMPMNFLQGDSLFDYYELSINDCNHRFKYYFKMEGKDGSIYFYNERGILTKEPYNAQVFQFPYICIGDLYKEVPWIKNSVVYQIFPDRFYNGNKKNDPPYVQKWGTEVDYYKVFGGDIRGITDKLDYLEDLGINVIYMTPIFSSVSNHKYNTKDYYNIDPMFGTKEELRVLVDSAHKRGIRVILDGVFNHSGHDFFAFEDLLKNGMNSSYIEWYFPKDIPVDTNKVNYITFGNHSAAMPKLRMAKEEVRKYFTEVGKYWIRECNIDGWRLDVCDEIDHIFLKEFYSAIKSEKPDAYIIGEIMHGNGAFLRGDEIDGTMNYPFREAVLDFFAYGKINAKEFADALAIRRHDCMKQINIQMLNLLDSHDTARFLTDANHNIQKLMLAVVFQFTYVGIPYIYYGDEIGMSGENDPYCRRCMEWEEEKQNKGLYYFFKQLIKIRKENPQLINGDFKVLYSEEYNLVYSRKNDQKETIVLLNCNETKSFIYDLERDSYKNMLTNEMILDNYVNVQPLKFLILDKKMV